MSFMELKLLILAQLGIDVIIIILFVFFIRRLRYPNKTNPVPEGVKIFESLLTEADSVAGQFKEQMEEKHRLVKSLSEQLDKRIISLNVLLNRADVLLSSHHKEAVDDDHKPFPPSTQQTEILELAEQGRNSEEIAGILSIPKEEVKLVLDLKNKLSQIGHEKGES
jgi:hypothetical protein